MAAVLEDVPSQGPISEEQQISEARDSQRKSTAAVSEIETKGQDAMVTLISPNGNQASQAKASKAIGKLLEIESPAMLSCC